MKEYFIEQKKEVENLSKNISQNCKIIWIAELPQPVLGETPHVMCE